MSRKRIRIVRKITYEGEEPYVEEYMKKTVRPGHYSWAPGEILIEEVSREEIPESDEKGGTNA